MFVVTGMLPVVTTNWTECVYSDIDCCKQASQFNIGLLAQQAQRPVAVLLNDLAAVNSYLLPGTGGRSRTIHAHTPTRVGKRRGFGSLKREAQAGTTLNRKLRWTL